MLHACSCFPGRGKDEDLGQVTSSSEDLESFKVAAQTYGDRGRDRNQEINRGRKEGVC